MGLLIFEQLEQLEQLELLENSDKSGMLGRPGLSEKNLDIRIIFINFAC